MASKRDQLQAFQFLAQRTISALITRESDPEQPPFRRPSGAAFGSIMLAAVVLAVTAAIGMISPGGNKAWSDGKSVIVVSETGTRYVYLNGHLHPVRNYASALLALGDHAETVSVSRNSLTDVPRGPEIGIPDAPDALPGPDRILTSGWALCTRPGTDATGSTVDKSVLLAGDQPRDGTGLGQSALLVQARETGTEYLLWNGYRHRIDAPGTVGVGLSLPAVPHVQVGMAFVDILPEGAPIAPIGVPGIGKPSTAVPQRPDLRAGAVLTAQTSGGARQFYLTGRDSLRPISKLQSDIQLAYQPTAKAYRGGDPMATQLGLSAVAGAVKQPQTPAIPGAAPTELPRFVGSNRDSTSVCASFDDGSFVPHLRVDPTLPATDTMNDTPVRTSRGTPIADQVFVRPGWAALVRVMSSPDAPSGTVVLVTDQGRAYPLANPDVQRTLGYETVTPMKMPGRLVARIPMGSGLDPAQARQT